MRPGGSMQQASRPADEPRRPAQELSSSLPILLLTTTKYNSIHHPFISQHHLALTQHRHPDAIDTATLPSPSQVQQDLAVHPLYRASFDRKVHVCDIPRDQQTSLARLPCQPQQPRSPSRHKALHSQTLLARLPQPASLLDSTKPLSGTVHVHYDEHQRGEEGQTL